MIGISSNQIAIFSFFGSISLFASIFVTISIFTVPKLRAHPNIMIGFISLFESISCYHTVIWSVNSLSFIEFFGLQNLMKYTFIPPITSTKDACVALCSMNRLLGSGFFEMMSLGMNTCLCIDLYLTLKQPFYPAQRRLKFYLFGSFLYAFIVTIIQIMYVSNKNGLADICSNATDRDGAYLYNAIIAICLSFYILIALFSVVFTGRMLSKPGISQNIKKLFLKKHILYVVGFIAIWIVTLSSAYRTLYQLQDKSDIQKNEHDLLMESNGYSKVYLILPNGMTAEKWVGKNKNDVDMDTAQVVSLMATISSGLVMAIIRCFEPYFIFITRKVFKMIYGIPWTINDEQEKYGELSDTISTFLNSSLNIELVHIILKSITDDCKNQKRLDLPWKDIYNDFDKYCVKEKHDYYEIEIEDPDAWAIDNLSKSKKKEFNTNKKIIRITEDIEVTQLAPEIFNCIRKVDGITNDLIIKSLNPNDNREMVFKAGEGSGKSGSFFFFSHDREFIIKTMSDGEYKTFMSMFKSYTYHCLKNNNSLLARIYGIFTVKIEKLEPVNLIMMGNTVQSMWNDMKLKYIFDLKGSLINRETKINMKLHKPGMTLKDINLLTIRKGENILKFSSIDRANIMDILEKDVHILNKVGIMDYSLLIAIENNQMYTGPKGDRSNEGSYTPGPKSLKSNSLSFKPTGTIPKSHSRKFTTKSEDIVEKMNKGFFFDGTRHRFISYSQEYIYHIAIIDYLQLYNLDKKSEHFFKTIFRGSGAEISSVPPDRYMKRYIEFMRNEVIIDEKNRGSKTYSSE